jgi:DivIVA domain-containing protein
MRCRECAAEVAVTGRVCSRCEAPIVGQPTVVGAVIRHLRESYEGTNVAGVVLLCASALVGIFFILGSVGLYVANRDLAAHGVRTQGQVVYADADGSDEVDYTVDGTDYQVPAPEVGDRLPGDAVTVVYDPRDPATSNLEDDSVAWHLHWILLGVGLFFLAIPTVPVVAGVFEADGPVGRRLPRARPARRQPETPPTPPGDTVVGAVSDAAGTAVRARVAEQAPREPYVPGSGDKVPAELRLVLDGYAGIACGWFAGGLACAVAAVFLFFFADPVGDPDDDWNVLLIWLVVVAGVGCISGLLEALKARIRFSRLLRRLSDPRTATVTASKRGGRTLIFDILPRDGTRRGYQPLSEVRLALWTKAGMLVPGERVKIYTGPGGKSPLLVSSPQWGRAFLGTVQSRSTVQPGPVTPLDERVSDAILADWAEWADSTTFSKPSWRRRGYEQIEVDNYLSAIRDTFIGVSKPPLRADNVSGKQFPSTYWFPLRGYDKTQVAAFLDAAGMRLAAIESTDRPDGPLASDAILADWAEWADSTRFSTTAHLLQGYATAEVDAFRSAVGDTFLGVSKPPVRSHDLRGKQFSTHRPGYDKMQVDAFLEQAAWRLAAVEPTDGNAALGDPPPDAVVVAQAVGRSEAVRKNVREAVGTAIGWGMVVGVIGITVVDDEDAFWSDATLVVAIAATITVVVFVVRTVCWAETTRVEVHPHEIVTEAVSWWRRSPTRVAIGFDEITSVDLDDEDGLLKVQTTLGRTLSGIPDGPGHAAALAIGQRLVAHGRAHTIQNDDTRIHRNSGIGLVAHHVPFLFGG